MKKLLFIVSLALFMGIAAMAQPATLYIKSGDKGLFLEHKVAAKENFFAVGRLYNAHPKAIAAYNKLDMNKGLVIGQSIRIPLTDTNFTQDGNSGTPVYYKAAVKEDLSKVSKANNNVTVEHIRNWNNLSSNTVAAGSKVVIGFLLTKEMPAVTLGGKATVIKEEPITESVRDAEPIKTEPVVVKQTENRKDDVIKGEPKKEEPVISKQTETSSASDNSYFKYHYEQQIKTNPATKYATVTSGIFKTSSGWLDSKYYLLIDGVQPGTIVKITNPATNKTIYAKVLGEMAGIRQNEGYDIRISSAGASALQITEQDKFVVKVNYAP